MTKRLFLLQVAINNYPVNIGKLFGCINDQETFKAFIEQRYSTVFDKIIPKVLTNEDATRANIIAAFDHFKEAKNGDTCVFTYSGHGAQIDSPPEFIHVEPDEKLETLVPIDAKLEGGGPILDKELGYLIWKVTNNKNIHFVAIMDCCHSGNITRYEKKDGERIRRTRKLKNILKKDQIIGIDDPDAFENGVYKLKKGRHILLTATKSREEAKEIEFDGKSRGVFTMGLFQMLSTAGRSLTYQQLMTRVGIYVNKLEPRQTPQLELTHNEDKDLYFLSNDKYEGEEIFYVENQNEEWHIAAGATGGIRLGDEENQTTFQLKKTPQLKLTVEEVMPNRSRVTGMDNRGGLMHEAVLDQLAIPKIRVGLSKDVSDSNKKTLQDTFKEMKLVYMELVDGKAERELEVHSDGENFWLTYPFGEQELFKQVAIHKPKELLYSTNKVAKWLQVLDWDHPGSELNESHYEINFYKTKKPNDLTKDAATEEVTIYPDEPVFMPQRIHEGKWYDPAFKMRVVNHEVEYLWFSVLYMESNFGINNVLMPAVELALGQEAWVEYTYKKDERTQVIQVWVDNELYKKDTISVYDYLKVIISTENPKTNNLFQEGLPIGGVRIKRGMGRKLDPINDWTTELIPLHLHRPFETKELSSGNTIKLSSLQLEGPANFSADCSLNEYNIAVRRLKTKPFTTINEDEGFEPFIFMPALYRKNGLSVVTLRKVNDLTLISEANPLEITFTERGYIPENELFLPVAADPNGDLRVLPHKYEDGRLHLFELPEPTSSEYEGLEDSIKIFFHKRFPKNNTTA